MERVPAISSEEGGGLDEGRGSQAVLRRIGGQRSPVIADQIQYYQLQSWLPTNTGEELRTGTLYFVSPGLAVSCSCIQTSKRSLTTYFPSSSKSDFSPLRPLSGPFKQRINRNATVFSSLTHFV